MSDWTPGEGWCEAQNGRAYPDGSERLVRWDGHKVVRVWVREEPVPPLPTEPYTVIRMTPPDGYPPALYVHNGEHFAYVTPNAWLDRVDSSCAIEVLAEPRGRADALQMLLEEQSSALDARLEEQRRETAKAVLDRVHEIHHSAGDLSVPARFADELNKVGREFKVTS